MGQMETWSSVNNARDFSPIRSRAPAPSLVIPFIDRYSWATGSRISATLGSVAVTRSNRDTNEKVAKLVLEWWSSSRSLCLMVEEMT